jgi:hypothetical protein
MARIEARLEATGAVSRRRSAGPWEPVEPRTDWTRVDATTEVEIERQAASDDAEAAKDAAAWVRAFAGVPDFHKPSSRRGSVYLLRQCAIGNEASSSRRAPPVRFCA